MFNAIAIAIECLRAIEFVYCRVEVAVRLAQVGLHQIRIVQVSERGLRIFRTSVEHRLSFALAIGTRAVRG